MNIQIAEKIKQEWQVYIALQNKQSNEKQALKESIYATIPAGFNLFDFGQPANEIHGSDKAIIDKMVEVAVSQFSPSQSSLIQIDRPEIDKGFPAASSLDPVALWEDLEKTYSGEAADISGAICTGAHQGEDGLTLFRKTEADSILQSGFNQV